MGTFVEKLRDMQQRSGMSYRECCRRLGGRGGLAKAARMRAARKQRELIREMQERLQRQKLE